MKSCRNSFRPILQSVVVFALVFSLPWSVKALRPGGQGRQSIKALEKRAERRPWLDLGDRRISAREGVTLALYNIREPSQSADPAEGARLFFESHRRLFGGEATVEQLRLLEVRRSPAGFHVQLRQEFRGLPVYNAFYSLTIDRQNRVRMVVANPIEDFFVSDITPGYSADDAIERSRRLLAVKSGESVVPTARLVGYRDSEGIDRLAYQVSLVCADPLGDWEVILDAISGEHLETLNRMKFDRGAGYVFDPDPLTSANLLYGDFPYYDLGPLNKPLVPMRDFDDADTWVLNWQRFEVTLLDITFEDGAYRLKGPYVEVVDFEPPHIAPVVNAISADFHFTRGQSGFEDVMVYYHIDLAQRHLQSLGFTGDMGIQDRPIIVDSHGVDGEDNSYYNPSTNRISFGEGGVDDAEDADVILHEYGHAILSGIHGSVWGGGDTDAMGEGFGDYWAGTFSARRSLFGSNRVFNWDGHNEFWSGRRLDNPGDYPDDWSDRDIYDNGEIWSSALWQIRSIMDPDSADKLIVQHSYLLGYGATVKDAAVALLDADLDLYDGKNQSTIIEILTAKGFIPAVTAREFAVVPMDFSVAPAFPNPFNHTTTWKIRLPRTTDLKLTVYDLLGRVVDRRSLLSLRAGIHRISWTANQSLPSGMYFVSIDAGPSEHAFVKIVLMK